MKRLVVAVAIVLLFCSAASAGWWRVGPAPVVYSYWPVGPVYGYPAPVLAAPAVVSPVPMVAPTSVLYPAPGAWRGRVYYYGYPTHYVVRPAW